MENNRQDLVDGIFSKLKELGMPVYSRRRSGVSSTFVERELADLGLRPPEDLLSFYEICDGTSTYEGDVLATIQLFPGFYWLSIIDCVEVFKSISESDNWNKAWLPIFANGGGDFYAVICDRESSSFGEIVGFVIGEYNQIAEFKSIDALFETIARSFSTNVFYAQNGILKADYPKMREVARQVQPGFIEHEV